METDQDGQHEPDLAEAVEGAARPLRDAYLIWTIAAVAFALRVWGLAWALPNSRHLFSYHPDEGVNLVNGVLVDGIPQLHLHLGFYNYGSLYFYLWQAAASLSALMGAGRGASSPAQLMSLWLIQGRILSAAFGAFTVVPIYAIARRLVSTQVGLVAAALYAVTPGATLFAHFATVDSLATLLTACALAAGAALVQTNSYQKVVLAGVLCGAAGAAKYNCILVAASPVAALWLFQTSSVGRRLWSTAILVGSAAAAFILLCPGAILDSGQFSHDILYELHKSALGMGLIFQDTGNGWWYHAAVSLPWVLGVPLVLVGLVGIVVAACRRSRGLIYTAPSVLIYYLVIGAAQVKFTRYVLPVVPVYCLYAAALTDIEWSISKVVRRIVRFAVGGVALFGAVLSLRVDSVMAGRDARDIALAVMEQTLKPGARVAFARLPWYDVPPLAPEFGAPSPVVRRLSAERLTRYISLLPPNGAELDAGVIGQPAADMVVISSIASEDWVRLSIPAWVTFRAILNSSYTEQRVTGRPAVPWLKITNAGYVPNDQLYICPTISLYRPIAAGFKHVSQP